MLSLNLSSFIVELIFVTLWRRQIIYGLNLYWIFFIKWNFHLMFINKFRNTEAGHAEQRKKKGKNPKRRWFQQLTYQKHCIMSPSDWNSLPCCISMDLFISWNLVWSQRNSSLNLVLPINRKFHKKKISITFGFGMISKNLWSLFLLWVYEVMTQCRKTWWFADIDWWKLIRVDFFPSL